MKKFLIVDGSSIFYRAFYAMPALTAPERQIPKNFLQRNFSRVQGNPPTLQA